jgi:hypothetical protein
MATQADLDAALATVDGDVNQVSTAVDSIVAAGGSMTSLTYLAGDVGNPPDRLRARQATAALPTDWASFRRRIPQGSHPMSNI